MAIYSSKLQVALVTSGVSGPEILTWRQRFLPSSNFLPCLPFSLRVPSLRIVDWIRPRYSRIFFFSIERLRSTSLKDKLEVKYFTTGKYCIILCVFYISGELYPNRLGRTLYSSEWHSKRQVHFVLLGRTPSLIPLLLQHPVRVRPLGPLATTSGTAVNTRRAKTEL